LLVDVERIVAWFEIRANRPANLRAELGSAERVRTSFDCAQDKLRPYLGGSAYDILLTIFV
jgi:hypothetical protein